LYGLDAPVDGQLDVAVVQEPVEDPLLESERLFEDQVLIIHNQPETTYLIQHVLRPAGVVPRRVLQLRLTHALIESVAAGLGVSCLARWVVAPQLEAGRLVALRLGRSGVRREWGAVWSRARRRSRPVVELIGLLERDAFGTAECCAAPPEGVSA
jgi:DNA-binding transcriptional LysR family regulator